ncbi:MAG TPA: alpha/beta fold hydrolase [Anaerolineales bacterium]|nr:alpha/beta fold hydrolase [Anaerolineales bacterium]HLO34039.1 alpha/beta fold hydrolase [Anaerolineales bacterium]
MQQEIRFCKARDGTRLAYAKVGQGPPLVKVGNWMSHLEYDLDSPVWKPWLENWTRFNTFYRYDPRGCGLSDRDVVDFSFEAMVSDLEAVVDDAGLEQFGLFSMSQGGCVSIAYAARHPERVRQLIVYGGYLQGSLSGNPTKEAIEEAEVQLMLFKLSWGNENPAYRQVFTTFLIPEGTPEQFAWFNNLQLVSTSPANAMSIQRSFNNMDVVESAKTIKVPTMVIHAKQDATVPFESGRQVAALIPGARLTILESKNHVLMKDEPAWIKFWGALYQFLGVGSEADVVKQNPVAVQDQILLELSAREREVLKLVADGKQNPEIAKRLSLSEKTVRNYISNIYTKLQINSRGEAIVLGRKSGLLDEK